jgi:hypothetical protein
VRAATEVEDLHDVVLGGACEGVHGRYCAITTDRRIRHPALNAVVERARDTLHAARGRG